MTRYGSKVLLYGLEFRGIISDPPFTSRIPSDMLRTSNAV